MVVAVFMGFMVFVAAVAVFVAAVFVMVFVVVVVVVVIIWEDVGHVASCSK